VLSAGSSCLVIDPGMDPAPLLQLLDKRQLKVMGILLTHGHLDHIAGCNALEKRDSCPIYLHPEDRFLYNGLVDFASFYGFDLEPAPQQTLPLSDGQKLSLAGLEVDVIATPGHSPGGVCFLLKDSQGDQHVYSGDTIFRGSYGRTDLPGGDILTLQASIRDRLFQMDPSTFLYPGHGPSCQVRDEQTTNPILFVESSDE
jgi:hydroxyacylglutathione hydrolase